MTTADQTGELTAGGMLQQQHGDSQGRPIVQERTRTPRAGKTVSGTHHQPGTVPPALRPAGLLQRPGMGRQMSSVVSLYPRYVLQLTVSDYFVMNIHNSRTCRAI